MNVIDPRSDDGHIPMYIKPHIEIHTYSNHTVPTNHETEATSTKALWDIHLDYISTIFLRELKGVTYIINKIISPEPPRKVK